MWKKLSSAMALTAAFSMLVNACSTNAKILKVNNTSVSAKIVRADAEAVYIKGYGAEVRVPRSEILDISHPGKGLMWVGGSFFAAGATVLVLGAVTDGKTYTTTYTYSSSGSTSSSSSKTDSTGFYIAGGVAAGLGLTLFLLGYNNYSTSKDNLESGGLSLGFPAGMNLGYETMMRPGPVPGAGTESVHQVKITLRL